MHFEVWQLALGVLAAAIVGFSKTGVPGTGILVVPIMAWAFGARLSVGATLPLLIMADCFAVAFYRSHGDWGHLRRLSPWVVSGLVIGTVFMKFLGEHEGSKDLLNPVIGAIVLVMLALTLAKPFLGDRLMPTSPGGVVTTGALAGFTTMTSNAAGPIMQIYLAAAKLDKMNLMGTTAWYFFIFNLLKLPFLIYLTLDNPGKPMMTHETLVLDAMLFPVILAGALAGRALLTRIPQKLFQNVVLFLAFVGALALFIPKR